MPATAVPASSSGVVALEIDSVAFTPQAFFGASVSGTGTVQFFDGTSSSGNPLTAALGAGTAWLGDQSVAVTSGSVYAEVTGTVVAVAYLAGAPSSDVPPPA